jgi:hypothetical protein
MRRNSKSTCPSIVGPLARQICDLRRERAQLEEEVLQLRAAVNIWAEVCRQTVSGRKGPSAAEIQMG